MLGVRKFRELFPTLTEPVDVIRSTGHVERLGTWYPEKRDTSTKAETNNDK